MNERYQHLQEIFLAAKEHESTGDAFDLVRACADDPELIPMVEALLAASREDTSSLDTPLLGTGFNLASIRTEDAFALVGESVGAFEILSVISEGGMGIVYRARQDEPAREVALKFLRPGSAQPALRRLKDEVQILGGLQHPGIAQVYDAGVVETRMGPQPFFAMEYVRGRTFLHHAGEQRLSIQQRVELLAAVCDAVQYAHQRGVIHRDLKPANVLVSEEGMPKVIDFGIARSIDDAWRSASLRTASGELIGTLPYMSPEQVDGRPEDVDVRSDLYALGVLGYELLAGRMPYDLEDKSFAETARIIAHEPPIRLGVTDRSLRSDLETIFAKSLEKERDRRYASAAELAADLRRTLRHEPITARPTSLGYQLRKFAQRNRAACSIAAIAIAVAVTGSTSTILGWSEAAVQMRAAETAREDSEALTSFLESMWTGFDPEELGREVLVRDMLEAAVETIDNELSGRPLIEARARLAVGKAYVWLGVYPPAQDQLETACALQLLDFGEEDPRTIESRRHLADLYVKLGDLHAAAAIYFNTIQSARRVLGAAASATLVAQARLADVYRQLGSFDDAEGLLGTVLDELARQFSDEDDRTLTVLDRLAQLRRDQGRYAEALSLLQRVWCARVEVDGPESLRAMTAAGNLAVAYRERGDLRTAEGMYREILETRRRLLGERDPRTLTTMNNLGRALHEQRRYADAEPILTRTLALRREVLGPENPHTLISLGALGGLMMHTKRLPQAQKLFEEALEVHEHRYGQENVSTLIAMTNLAECHQEQGHMQEARRLFATTLEVCERVLGERHAQTTKAANDLGTFYLKNRKPAQAEPLLARVVRDSKGMWRRGHLNYGVFLLNYGETLRQLGKLEEAEEPLLEALDIFTTELGHDHERSRLTNELLDLLYLGIEKAELVPE